MKAKLKNETSKDYPQRLVELEGFFEFESIKDSDDINTDMFAPIDKNFPSSTPIIKSDLEFKNAQKRICENSVQHLESPKQRIQTFSKRGLWLSGFFWSKILFN